MKRCSSDCIPCCDYCIHVKYFKYDCNGKIINGGPESCELHPDETHKNIAISCGCCDDFHCMNA